MNNELILKAYYEMLRIRLVEERIVQEYLKTNRRSFVHFCIGQEAVAVGVCMNLRRQDYVFGNHRSHGHYLAKGGDLKKMIAELYGKETGCAHGRGGSMHLIDREVNFMGSISILASVVPIAVGAGFSAKQKGEDRISVVFLGDGASDEGVFYESVNFASLFKIPILFVIENNIYAAMSPRENRHSKWYDMEKIINGLGVNYYKINGNDLFDVYHTTRAAVYCVRGKNLPEPVPAVLEGHTFRHMAHSAPIMDDNLGYRKIDTKEVRERNCPIKKLKEYIIKTKIEVPEYENDIEDYLVYMEACINEEIDLAIKFAEESPEPDPKDLMRGVYGE